MLQRWNENDILAKRRECASDGCIPNPAAGRSADTSGQPDENDRIIHSRSGSAGFAERRAVQSGRTLALKVTQMTKYSTSDDSTDFDNTSDDVTLNDANTASAGYQSEAQIAKRKYDFDTPETNENPEVKELEAPTAPMGAHLENQEELLTAAQVDEDGQSVETGDDTAEMQGFSVVPLP